MDRTIQRQWRYGIALLGLIMALGLPDVGRANQAPQGGPEICEAAAAEASRRTGVPLNVLRAITLTETGRSRQGRLEPWPWTVNMEGKGLWFDSRDAALHYATTHAGRGARSFDVGCFQLNYRWHGKGFQSIEQMFDPAANALYAAKFLADLYREKGDWAEAAGAYHSRTPRYASKYKARFARILARIDDRAPEPAPPSPELARAAPSPAARPPAPRVNRFPLLQPGAGGSGALGSLFPADAGIGNRRLIGGGRG